MSHTKTLEIQEPTHQVLTVEDNYREPQQLFTGSYRECEAYINKSGLITLEIKPI